jgi:hypothetical protein
LLNDRITFMGCYVFMAGSVVQWYVLHINQWQIFMIRGTDLFLFTVICIEVRVSCI